jgi:hypothetical protein
MILKRVRDGAGVFVTLVVVVAIVVALTTGLIGYLAAAATAGVRDDLASQAGGDAVLRMSLPVADDEQAQDGAVRELLSRTLRNGGRPIPIDVDRIVRSESAVPIVRTDPVGDALLFASTVVSIGEGSAESIEDAASLVDGDWPDSADQVTVQADTAIALGIGAGSAVSVGGDDVTVSGTWRLRDGYRGALAADPLFSAASGSDTAGPVVIDESAWTAVGVDRSGQWTIAPRVGRLEHGDLPAILTGWSALPAAYRAEEGPDATGLRRSGGLVATAVRVQGRVDALGAIAPVALIVLSAIALLTVLELARLLARIRSAETALRSARGSPLSRIAASTAAEAGAAALLGALLGVAAAVGAVFAVGSALGVGGAQAVSGAGPALWAVPLLVVGVVAGVAGVVTARSGTADARAEESGRLSRTGLSGAVVLVAAAAALSTWQLRVYGSPVTPSRDGGSQVDPIGVLAPAAVVVAVVLVGFAGLAVLAPAADRWGSARRFRSATVLRNVHRRLPQAVTPFVLCALACGQLVFAAGYSATWDRAFSVATELRTGAAVRLTGAGGGLSSEVRGTAAAVEGVAAVAPVISRDTVIASEPASFVAVAPGAIRELAVGVPGVLDPAVVAEAIVAPTIEPGIPAGAEQVTLSISTDGFEAPPAVDLVLADRDGRVTRESSTADAPAEGASDDAASSAGAGTGGDARSLEVPLADAGTGPWTVKAVEVTIPAELSASVAELDPPSFELTAITAADGTDVPVGDSWFSFDVGPGASPPPAFDPQTSPRPGNARFDVLPEALRMRLMPSLVRGGDRIRPPIAVSRSLAERSGLSVGDVIPVDIDARWTTQDCLVQAIVPAVPGAVDDRAVLMDVGVVESILLRSYTGEVAPEEAWIGVGAGIDAAAGTADADTAATLALRRALPSRVAAESLALDPTRAILSSSKAALWIGAIGTALLALFTLAAVARSGVRARLGEVLVLRALGVRARELGRLRGGELAAVLLAGSAVGGLAGAAVTVLTASQIARSALPDLYTSLPVAVRTDAVLLGIVLAAFGIAAALIVAASARAVRSQARSAAAGVVER